MSEESKPDERHLSPVEENVVQRILIEISREPTFRSFLRRRIRFWAEHWTEDRHPQRTQADREWIVGEYLSAFDELTDPNAPVQSVISRTMRKGPRKGRPR